MYVLVGAMGVIYSGFRIFDEFFISQLLLKTEAIYMYIILQNP